MEKKKTWTMIKGLSGRAGGVLCNFKVSGQVRLQFDKVTSERRLERTEVGNHEDIWERHSRQRNSPALPPSGKDISGRFQEH